MNSTISQPLSALLDKLDNVKPSPNGQYTARCPAHEDKNNSLSISEANNGKILLHCHANCSFDEVCRAIGIDKKELSPHKDFTTKTNSIKKEIVAKYTYTDENGTPIHQTIRYNPKEFRQCSLFSDGNVKEWTLKNTKPVLYNLPNVLKYDVILLVEGEKDADNLNAIGFTATTQPMGTGKWKPHYTDYLKGKTVYIFPDNDPAGRQGALTIASQIKSTCNNVLFVDLADNFPELAEKGDISDVLQTYNSDDKFSLVTELLSKAKENLNAPKTTLKSQQSTEVTPNVPFYVSANEIKSRAVPWLIPDFIVRGGLNSLQGLPDSGKSWLSLAITAAVAKGGMFPDNNGTLQKICKGSVLYANFDDDLEYTIKARLDKIGISDEDSRNIKLIRLESGLASFDDSRLATAFEEVKPDLAIFDTLQHFIGKADMHRVNETNAALMGIRKLAEKHNTAVVIIQHISKQAGVGNGGSSVNWGLGSIGINGLFRSVWTIGKLKREQEQDFPYRKALLPAKTNLVAITPPARLFDLDPERGFVWAGVDETVTSDDLIQGDTIKCERGRPSEGKTDVAKAFLQEVLANGTVKSADVEQLAEERGILWRTVRKAKESLNIQVIKEGKTWCWSLI